MNSFIKSLASSAGVVIINILSNNELVNFETRLDVIAEIFKKYSGDNDKIKYMLHAFQSINKSLIEEIGLDKLFEVCEQCQNTIFPLTYPSNISTKKQLEIINKIPNEYKNNDSKNYKKIFEIFSKCSWIGEEALNLLDIEKVIDFCSQDTALPLNWYKVNSTSVDQQLDNIKTVLLKYNSNILDIYPDETNILGQMYNEDEGGY